MFPEIQNPMPIRKHVDFISNPFTQINIFAFCDQVPFWVYFKRHCTRQWLNLVSSLTVRTRLFWGDAPMFPEILNPTPIRNLVDFISNPFTEINIFAFCDQVPFWVHFKRHCTRQWLNFVLSLTVRIPLFWGDWIDHQSTKYPNSMAYN